MSLKDRERAFLERFGRFWEAQGGSRIAGKIVGWLMVCDPPQQSSAQLVDVLEVSHGSVSTQIRQLERLGYVERVTFPRDRTSYFVLNHAGWSGIMEESWSAPVAELKELGAIGEELAADIRPERARDLVLMSEFLLSEWPGFIQRMKMYIAEHSSAADDERVGT